MARNRASAKAAGSSFERLVADYLAEHVDDRIDRRVKTGAVDRGDITGMRYFGKRVVIECKNEAKVKLGPWMTETEIERGNDDALFGVIAHKRHGKGQAKDQWITMTLSEFVAIINQNREHVDE